MLAQWLRLKSFTLAALMGASVAEQLLRWLYE
jgi:hypothetical protein